MSESDPLFRRRALVVTRGRASTDAPDGQDCGRPEDGADARYAVQDAIAPAAHSEDRWRQGRSDGGGEGTGDVHDAEVLGGAVRVGQYVGDERQVDGHVEAEAEASDGHAEQETAEGAGHGDYEHRQAEDRGGDADEDLPSSCPVRHHASDQGW